MSKALVVPNGRTHDVDAIAARLGISVCCLYRLVGAGYVTPFRLDMGVEQQIRVLRQRPLLEVERFGRPVIALHAGPATRGTSFAWMPWSGIDCTNSNGLGEYHRLLAFTAGWLMPPATVRRLVGSVALAGVDGFLDSQHALQVLAIDQVRDAAGRCYTRMFGTPLNAYEKTLVDGHRIEVGEPARAGSWNWLT